MTPDLEYLILEQRYNLKGYQRYTKEKSKSNTTSQEKYLTEGYLENPSGSLT